MGRFVPKRWIRGGLVLVTGAVLAVRCTPGTNGLLPDYAIAISPAALTIARGANGSTTVTIARITFTGMVALSLPDAPTGVTGSFDPAETTGTTSALTVSVGPAVTLGVHNLTVRGTGTPGNRPTPLTLTVN